eukprot:2375453-Pyramimonas_sp.AAC.1
MGCQVTSWHDIGDESDGDVQPSDGMSTLGVPNGSYFIGVRRGREVVKLFDFMGHQLSLTDGIELNLGMDQADEDEVTAAGEAPTAVSVASAAGASA